MNADGSWLIPNVPANFGLVRARATCTIDGKTLSGQSDPFVVPPAGTVEIPPITFGQTTPIPSALSISAATTTLTPVGATVRASVIATYPDGSTRDVSSGNAGTIYRTSSPGIVAVTPNGLLTGINPGKSVIQAINEGASALFIVQVFESGTDSDGDGIPDDDEVRLGLNPGNPVDAFEDPDRDGLTNLQEFQQGTNPRNADTDGDTLSDGDEVTRYGSSPLLRDTDGDGIPDGVEVGSGTSPTDSTSYDFSRALKSLAITPANFTLTFNTISGDVSRQLTVTGTFLDGTTINLTARQQNTQILSSDLNVCNFGSTPGQVFAGQTGNCTISASVGTFTALANGTVHTFSPTPLSFVAIPGFANNVDVNGDIAYVAAGSQGLQIVDVSNRNAPHIVASLALSGNANDVKVSGDLAFVAGGFAGLHIVDISNPLSPQLLGTALLPGDAWDVRPSGTMVYVADGTAGLQIVDVSDPRAPRVVGEFPSGDPATGVDVSGTLVALTVENFLGTFNVSNPVSPELVGVLELPKQAKDLVLRGSYAFVADFDGSLQIVDVSDPTTPHVVGTTNTTLGGILQDVAVADGFSFGADVFFVNGVPIVDVSTPSSPNPRAILNFSSFRDDNASGIAVDGSYVYLTAGTGIQDNGSDGDTRLYIGQYRLVEDLDGIAPTVTITAPANGTTVVEGQFIPISVAATDDIAVKKVDALLNGAVVSTDSTAPYQLKAIAPVGTTSITIGATAMDLGGNTGTATSIQLPVIPDPLTTVIGRTLAQDGTPIGGAAVTCFTQSTLSSVDGTFTVSGVPTTQPSITCVARFTTPAAIVLQGFSSNLTAVRGGTTNAGDVTLTPVPVEITTDSLANGFVGRFYQQRLTVSGAIGAVTWQLNDGSNPLPNGLSLSTDGVISGTPTQYGSRPAFTVRATDSLGRTATRSLTIFVDANLQFSTASLKEAAVIETYNQTIGVIGGFGGLFGTITAGALPPGLSINPTNGNFAGAPTRTGTFNFTVQVVDCTPANTCTVGTPQQLVTRSFTLRVSAREQQGTPGATAAIPFGGPGGRRMAQVVTVGAAGTLNGFGLLGGISCASPGIVTIDVQRLSLSGVPDGVTIASGASNGGFNGIALSPQVPIAIDERLAFVINSATSCTMTNTTANDNSYQAGDAYVDAGAGWVSLFSTDARYDIPFRTLIQPASDVVYFNRGRFDGARASELSGSTKVLVTGTDNTGDVYDQATNTATLTPAMNAAPQRFSHTSTLLDDGTVLIAGGRNSTGTQVRLATVDIYDPTTGVYTPTGNMVVGRDSAAAVKLPNGRVLIVGGTDTTGTLSSAEIYDPVARTFSSTGTMTTGRNAPVAVLLNNGKVLVAGGFQAGQNQRSAELYNPATGTFTATVGNMVVGSRGRAAATLLNDGRVFITGGQSGDIRAEAELYNPATDTFTATSMPMAQKRYNHTATLLPDGSVLVAGGNENQTISGYILPLATMERYIPGNDTFVPAGSMETRRAGHVAAKLANGKVLLIGGVSSNSWFIGDTGELFDVTSTPVLTTTSLPNGQVGVPYAGATLTASGGHAPYTITRVSGVVPPGLTYDIATASLTGTPLTMGLFSMGFKVTDSDGHFSQQTLGVRIGTINEITSPFRLTDAAQNSPYSLQLTASGAMPIVWSLLPSSGALPAGLSLSAAGIISGTPTTLGFVSFAVRAVDATGQAAIKSLAINTVNPLFLFTTVLPDAPYGENYTMCLTVNNGVGNRSYVATGLPQGVVLNQNGCFANAPKAIGTFNVRVVLSDSASPPEVITRDFTLRVPAKEQEGFTSNATSVTFGGPGGRRLAQTVTVGANGTLTTFGFNNNLSCQPFSAVSIEVQGLTLSGLPDGNTLASGSDGAYGGIALSPTLPVSVGQRLAFVVSAPNPCTVASGSPNDFYQAGDAYAELGGGWVPLTTTDNRTDLPFRTMILPSAPVTFLNASRNDATATVLNNGNVLIAGSNQAAEVYSPGTGASTPTGSMPSSLFSSTATLTDGRVLIAGGHINGNPVATAFTYDPATGVFTPTSNNLSVARNSSAAVRLANGRVLIVGGWDGFGNSAAADLYDPQTRSFTAIGSMVSGRNEPTATLLNNGKVLIAGGYTSGGASAEIYDPLAGPNGTFTRTAGSMVVFSRGNAAAALLQDGTVLIAGGQSGDITATAETYDPVTDQFTGTGPMTTPRSLHSATTLPDGTVLIAGGYDEQSVNSYTLPLATLERYNPMSRTFAPAGSMETRRAFHSAAAMTGGKVLLVGGTGQSWMSTNTAEVFDVSTAPAITPSVLPNGQIGIPYSFTVNGSGAGAPFTIAQVSGVLPPGVNYDAPNRTLSGTPTAAGIFTAGFKITSATGTNIQSLAIRIGNILAITSPYRLVDGALNKPYSLQLTSNGTPPVVWSIPAGAPNLPPGLTLSNNGLISGTPTAIGYYNFEVRAVDGTGQSALKALSISIQNALAITTTSLPEAPAMEPYGYCITAVNGAGTRTFSVIAGSVPPGMALQVNGCLANAPTALGSFAFTVQVSDQASPAQTVSQNLAIRVSAKEQTAYTNNGPTISFGGAGGRRLAQTITVGANGTLTGFGLTHQTICTTPNDFAVEVQRLTPSGLPDGATIASGHSNGGLNGIPLSGALSVSVGMRLAFIISSTTPCTVVDGSTTDFYQGGDGLAESAGAWISLTATDGRYDLPFQTLIQPAVPVAPLNRFRGGHVAAVLQNGKVLIAGSDLNAELYDPATNSSVLTGAMSVQRFNATATTLNDGKVLVAGGGFGNVRFDTAELYDPATGLFTPTANRMSVARETATATKLADGRVLIAGGWNGVNSSKAADIYDPVTRSFTPLTMTTARNVHTATLLQNGTVLLAGGFGDGAPTSRSAEIFDPTTNTFAPTVGDMVAWRGWAAAALLGDGRVLIAGGQAGDVVNSAEIYDPTTGRFTATGSMSTPRLQPTATLLADGSVLITGGLAEPGVQNYTLALATMERWVPAANGFAASGGMEARRTGHIALMLTGNRVLLAGGYGESWMTNSSVEVFQANATPSLTRLSIPAGTKDAPYTPIVFTASGGGGSPFAIDLVSGALPPGMGYNASTATLSGTPTGVGTYTLGLRVRDGLGQTNLQSLTLQISPVIITSPYRLPDGHPGQAYAFQLAPGSATWSLPQLSVPPPGLSLSSSGAITGAPTAPGYYNFVVRATDAFGQSTLKVVAIFVQ